ncbi:MAG TPA: hypothetical protein VL334_00035 [Anaerolineae bacterium]|nr:hypothetical protein [Anaerolineae bacterium]
MKTMQLTQKQKTLIGMGIAIAIALLIFILWYLLTHPVFTAALTDVWIILLALVVLVMNIFLIIMLWQIIRLIDFLLFELKPVLESLQETSSTVRGTASFVSDEVSSPIIDASAKTARVKGSLRFVVDSLMKGAQQSARGPQGTGAQGATSPGAPPPPWGAAGQTAGAGSNNGGPAADAPDQQTA